MKRVQRPAAAAPVTRRTFFRTGLGIAAGLIAARLSGRSSASASGGEVSILENCYWQTVQGPVCVGHRWQAYRCFVCCWPCETVTCEWQDLGAC